MTEFLMKKEKNSKKISPFAHSYWRNRQMTSGCVCVDICMAMRNAIKDACIDAILSTHRSNWGRIDLPTQTWRPRENRGFPSNISNGNSCIKKGRNRKFSVQFTKWRASNFCDAKNNSCAKIFFKLCGFLSLFGKMFKLIQF